MMIIMAFLVIVTILQSNKEVLIMRKLIVMLAIVIGFFGSGISIPSNSSNHPFLMETQIEAASFHQHQAEHHRHHDKKSKHHSAEPVLFSAKRLTILYIAGVVIMSWSLWYLKWAKEHDAF